MFLDLPPRAGKPRLVGLTHVLDKGVSLTETEDILSGAAGLVDAWKLGWGTAYVDPRTQEKVALLTEAGVKACLGGTLLEVAWSQGRTEDCLAWAEACGFSCVEVSRGAVAMSLAEKHRLVRMVSRRFVALAETGSKDPAAPVDPRRWAAEMVGDLEAGATWVLAEGRESGTVGLYDPDGRPGEGLVETLVGAAGLSRVVFEAPRPSQQAWFVRRFGPTVNLGNVVPGEVVGLEALRLGLRADTIELAEGPAGGIAPDARRPAPPG